MFAFPTELPDGVTEEAFHVACLSLMAEMFPQLVQYPNPDVAIATLSWFVASLYGHAHKFTTEPPVPKRDLEIASGYVLDQLARYRDTVDTMEPSPNPIQKEGE